MSNSYDEILIGEGVRLEAGYAPVTMRILSGILDVIAVVLVWFLGAALFGPVVGYLNEAAATAVVIALVLVVFVFLPATIETLTRGQSLGKLATGVRIVRDDGGPVSFRHAFLRALVGLVEIFLVSGTLATVVALVSPKGKRVGDYLAGTYALRVRGGTRRLPPVSMPPSLAAWASTADMRRLPDGLALTARLFIGRTAQLGPEARARLGTILGSELDRYVAPPPPAGTHVENFIAAVLAARRDREYALAIEQSRRADANSEAMRRLPYDVPDVGN
jgi:uncharacterized RDD family membrane protein YckC